MQPTKETAEWSKKQSEKSILNALRDAQYQMKDGGLLFNELVKKTGKSSATVNDALKRMRKKKAVEYKNVERKGRLRTLYYLSSQAHKTYPDAGISRKHYEELANRFDDQVEPKEFVSDISNALTKEFIESWIIAKTKGEALQYEIIESLINNFNFLINKYIFYRKNRNIIDKTPEKYPEEKRLNTVLQVLKNMGDAERYPANYKEQFKELLEAIRETTM